MYNIADLDLTPCCINFEYNGLQVSIPCISSDTSKVLPLVKGYLAELLHLYKKNIVFTKLDKKEYIHKVNGNNIIAVYTNWNGRLYGVYKIDIKQ